MFNPMNVSSAHQFEILGFDMLLMIFKVMLRLADCLPSRLERRGATLTKTFIARTI
jgi:hypothetical protein